jgi:hypothetical protein
MTGLKEAMIQRSIKEAVDSLIHAYETVGKKDAALVEKIQKWRVVKFEKYTDVLYERKETKRKQSHK